MFKVVEFEDASVGIIRREWLTAQNRRCLWPPHRVTSKFNKCLITQVVPDENWRVYPIRRTLYETDDLSKTRQKCKMAESESELASTDIEIETERKRRKRKVRVLQIDSDDNEEIDESYNHIKYPIPPNNDSPVLAINVDRVDPKPLLEDFNAYSLISSRSPTNEENLQPPLTPTTLQSQLAQKSVLKKINSSLDLIANYFGHIKSEIEEMKQTQNDILSRISSPSSALATLPVEIDIMPLKSVDDVKILENWLELEENKRQLINMVLIEDYLGRLF